MWQVEFLIPTNCSFSAARNFKRMHFRQLPYSILIACLAGSCSGATLNLDGVANNGSRFIEHRQGAFWELGQTRPSTRVDNPDGAFTYSELPNYVPQGGGGIAFPNKQDFWDLGVIEYDDATGEITGLEFDFEPHVAPGQFTYFQAVTQASAYATSFNAFSGAVTYSDVGLPTINLISEIVFSIDGDASGDGILAYTGSFMVTDNDFVLDVDDTAFSQSYQAFSGDGDLRVEWNVSGALTVPLVGDFNLDGAVDAADYTVWRDNAGSVGEDLAGDANQDQVVDEADYVAWHENYGRSAGVGALEQTAAPEPAAAALLLATLCGGALYRSAGRSRAARRDT
ncbi:hypothetical protein KOR34_15080 [Posidoniimonas corsicana]|uniref:PEP-CTERM protein-sorting domain-containing protein n=1 Tax=Posidoniimonas corsicana TaxID=1938618 RepID=A0A5C5VG40_9BACT|nr:hypothetical protein [Posidoniimonas corsicana]TWT36602.1 hypothetical protein KOR34_15080 [Posidoniimonas corsicana]